MAMVFFGYDHSTYDKYHYISPFFDPEVHLSWWPSNLSPGLILIWIPVGFRGTCYYARRVYYRAWFADPPACAVGELRKVDQKYKGENKWPWIINNLHRYFWYLAFVLMALHWISFFHSLYIDGKFTMGFGSLIILFDALFLTMYVLSCHACKHLVGGGMDVNSTNSFSFARFRSWKFIKKINENHHTWFWLSLVSVLVADIYIRLLSYGTISSDWRFF